MNLKSVHVAEINAQRLKSFTYIHQLYILHLIFVSHKYGFRLATQLLPIELRQPAVKAALPGCPTFVRPLLEEIVEA